MSDGWIIFKEVGADVLNLDRRDTSNKWSRRGFEDFLLHVVVDSTEGKFQVTHLESIEVCRASNDLEARSVGSGELSRDTMEESETEDQEHHDKWGWWWSMHCRENLR